MDLLDYLLAPGHETAPILITSRNEETPATDWLERTQRNPRIERLDLPPLSREETAEQIELLTDSRPTSELVDETYSRTAGNAFFTEQLVSAGGTLSAGLGSLLLARTAQVAGPARHLLDVLAIAAEPLDEPALIEVCGRTAPEVREALRDLLSRRLLRAPDAAGRHQLRHALLGEAIGDDMLPEARRELHLDLARRLADRDDRALAAQIAEHLAAAGRSGEELRWRVVAARQAEAALAAAEASAHWLRVLELWDETADLGVDLANVYLQAATTAEGAGHQPAAAALLEEALIRVAATARPGTQVRLYCEVGRSRGIKSMDAGLEMLGTAIRIGEQLPPSPAYVQALIHYMHLLDSNGQRENHLELISKGLDAARQLDDPSDEKVLLTYRAHLALRTGNRDDADEALQLAAQIDLDDPVADVVVAVVLTDLLEQSGDLAGAVDVGRQVLARPDMDGQSDWAGIQLLRGNVCGPLIELGDTEGAAALIDPVTAGAPDWDTSTVYLNRIAVDLLRGRLSDAARRCADTGPLLDVAFDKAAIPWFRTMRLELALWLADPDEPLAAALTTLADVADTHVSPFAAGLYAMVLRAHADLAELARATRDGRRLRAVLADAARLDELRTGARIDPFAARLLPVTCAAHGLTWQAEWSRVQGEPDPDAWERAAGAWDALARPHRAAYARWRQAEALLAMPHGRAAATTVLRRDAPQGAEHVPLSNAIRDLARRARIDIVEPVALAAEPRRTRPYGLTDREYAVLRLMAQGKTNSQIGTALFISTKTASVHVSNILRKLNASTRVQAATIAERVGLLDPAAESERS